MLYQAAYRVDKNGGGTLSSGSDSGKTALTYDVTSTAQSVSVTAVPQEGHVFVRWSDGVTQKTRTDTNFKQNVDVTAMFAQASISISSTGKAVLGDYYTFTAKLGGKHLTADSIRWYANGAEVPQAAGKTTVKVEIDPSMLNATFKVYAVASYNGCTVASNTVNVTVSGRERWLCQLFRQHVQLFQRQHQQFWQLFRCFVRELPPDLHPLPTAPRTALPAARARLPRQARPAPTVSPAPPTVRAAATLPALLIVRAAAFLPARAPRPPIAVLRRKAVLAPSLRKQTPARKLPTSRQHPRTLRPEAVTPSCRAA